MSIKDLIWLTHGMELKGAIDAIADNEWDSDGQFMDLVDIETSALHAAILVDETFSEYSDEQIQSAIMEAVNEYIVVDYYK